MVLGELDEYPVLLTIEEAAAVLRIGRSLAYSSPGSTKRRTGEPDSRCSESAHAYGFLVGDWPS